MIMNIQHFIEESKKMRTILYGDNIYCKEQETLYYDNYILDNPQNEAALDNIVNSRGIQLVLAKPGAGKSVSLFNALHKFVSMDASHFVVAVFPTRGLGEQMAVWDGVDQLLGGDDFNEDSKIVASVYEKIADIKGLLYREKRKGKKLILLLDEAHLLTTQMNLRKKAISSLIRDIEKHLFENVILVTATPEPLTLFHCHKITCFERRNQTPFIEEIQIVEVDDVRGYIESLDYGKEFPFIRLNSKDMINSIIEDNTEIQFGRLTAEDKQTKLYMEIVNEEKIDASYGMDGILTTNLLEAGISITKYPENIVPVFACSSYFISLDDIEQFFNRLRKSEGKTLKCARIVLPKIKEREEAEESAETVPFRSLPEIFERNEKVLTAFQETFCSYLEVMEQVRRKKGYLRLPDDLKRLCVLEDEALIEEWTNCCIRKMGELEPCLLFENQKLEIDKRMCYMVSYQQFQRQYYFNHDLLKEEVEQRMGTKTVLLQMDVKKTKRRKKKKLFDEKEPIWKDIEKIQLEIQHNLNCHYFLCENKFAQGYIYGLENLKLKEAFDYLLSLGIMGNVALQIMVNSKDMKEVKQYGKQYQIILGNQILHKKEALDTDFLQVYTKEIKEKLQIAIAYYIQSTGKQSIRINEGHIKGIEAMYVTLFGTYKVPTNQAIKRLMKKMYKIKEVKKDGTVILATELITNMNSMFKKKSDLEEEEIKVPF